MIERLGSAYCEIGELHKAIEYYAQELVIAREIGNRRGEATDLWNLSLELDKLGEREKAIAHTETALKIYQAIESPHVEQVRRQLAEWRRESG